MSERRFRSFGWAILGHKHGADPRSNGRRYQSRLSLVVTLALVAESLAVWRDAGPGWLPEPLAWVILAWSLSWFFRNVFFYPFLHRVDLDPERLLFDISISSALVIWAFAGVYRFGELAGAEGTLDALYFSGVSFSTLGYGDLVPKGHLKALAALQGVVGYVHLGVLVSALITAMDRTRG